MGSKKACEHYVRPFKMDCEEFLGSFQQTESVRYEDFSTIWREMDFSSVFFGNYSHHEKKSFTRLTFTIVYNYLLPPYSFQIRAGALYMLYGLYNKQVVWPKEKIRVALKDWFHIQQFISDAKMCQHLDVVYIFCRLLSDKAFYFTAMPKKLTFESGDRAQHDVNEDFRVHRDKVAELASTDMLEEIGNVHSHYERMKKSMLPTSAGVTLLNLADGLQKCTLEWNEWKEMIAASKSKDPTKKEAIQKSDSLGRADMLAAIKSKSYGHLLKESKSRRHRQLEKVVTGTESLFSRKKKPESLRARTCKNLGDPVLKGGEKPTQHYLLSVMEQDKNALTRKDPRRFNWTET